MERISLLFRREPEPEAAAPALNRRQKRAVHAILLVLAVIFLLPLLWLTLTALKPVEQVMTVPPSFIPKAYFAPINGRLTRVIVDSEPVGRPSVLVSAGGTGIYGDRGNEILTEDSEPGSGFLADLGVAWEAAAEPARAAGVRVVNFRQGIVLSRDGGALRRMLLPFRLGVGGRVGSGKQWWSWVSLDDLVSAYVLALEGDLAGPVNLASPNPATSAQFTKALGRALHRPTVFPLPAFAVKAVFGEKGDAVLLDGQRVLPARLLDAGFAFAQPDLDVALEKAIRK